MTINGLNNTSVFSEIRNLTSTQNAVPVMRGTETVVEDKVELTQTQTQKQEPPKIGFMRALFKRYTKEQIAQINETKEMPKNVKVVDDLTSPRLAINFMDITLGTHTLPAGYELRQDILGFTRLVREDSKAWYLRNK